MVTGAAPPPRGVGSTREARWRRGGVHTRAGGPRVWGGKVPAAYAGGPGSRHWQRPRVVRDRDTAGSVCGQSVTAGSTTTDTKGKPAPVVRQSCYITTAEKTVIFL